MAILCRTCNKPIKRPNHPNEYGLFCEGKCRKRKKWVKPVIDGSLVARAEQRATGANAHRVYTITCAYKSAVNIAARAKPNEYKLELFRVEAARIPGFKKAVEMLAVGAPIELCEKQMNETYTKHAYI